MPKTTTGRFTTNTDAHSKCSSSAPPVIGPMATPMPATAAQIPIAFGRSSAGKTFVSTDSVVGMMNAPPMPIRARLAISESADPGERREQRARAEHTEPEDQGPLAPEAVSEAAGREQQAGEHQDVRVDDPLHLRGRGPEIALDAGEGDVQDRVVQRDDEEAQREDPEDPPAPV